MNENEIRRREDEEIEIDLYDLLYLFRSKIVFLILAAVLGGALVFAATWFLVTPKYEATASLYIVSASNDSVVNLTDLQIGTNLTADYEELVLSRPMLESVIANLELERYEIDTDALAKMLTITNPAGTRILKITATSTIPQQAMDIANEMAEMAVTWLPEIMESNDPNISEDAVLPTKIASPSYVLNAAIGAMAAVLIYAAVVVLRYVQDDTIRTGEQMEKYFGITPLAQVPEEKVEQEGKTGRKHSHSHDEDRDCGRGSGGARLLDKEGEAS